MTSYQVKDRWRNGSAFDSRSSNGYEDVKVYLHFSSIGYDKTSKGYPFKSGVVQYL